MRDFFGEFGLFNLQTPHTILECGGNARHVGRDDAIYELLDLPLDTHNFILQMLVIRLFGFHAGVPQVAEHFGGQLEQFGRGAKAAEHFIELAFQHIAAHGFAA